MTRSWASTVAGSALKLVGPVACFVLFYAALRAMPLDPMVRASGFSIASLFTGCIYLASGRLAPGLSLALLGMLAIPSAATFF